MVGTRDKSRNQLDLSPCIIMHSIALYLIDNIIAYYNYYVVVTLTNINSNTYYNEHADIYLREAAASKRNSSTSSSSLIVKSKREHSDL